MLMAWRTTEAEVRKIIESDDTLDVSPFIDTATALTDYVSSKDSDSVLTSALLVQIEKYLAAHFYALRDAQLQSKATGGASGQFQGQTGMSLDLTWWGQQAKLLDVTGCLGSLSRGRQPLTLAWLGLPPSEQTDYEDRD